MSRTLIHNLAMACLALSGPATLIAQTPTASVTGTVRDTLGRPIRGAEVLALDVASGLIYQAGTTSETGKYWLRALRPGRYDLTARRIGFRSLTWRAASLSVGQTVSLDFTLPQVAVELEPLEVVADRSLLEATQSDVSFSLGQEQIARLPEESRQFIDLVLLAPGATAAPDNPEAVTSAQVGGLNSYSVGVLVDGGQLIDASNHEFLGSFPLLAIQEFEVLVGSYPAEFGQASSGIVNAVTRRGANEFIAEGFGLYRHRRINALGAFELTKPDFNRTHWGLAAGGPIRRDRTHFFVAVERRVENTFGTVETAGLFPNLEGTFDTPLEDNLLFARLDHRINTDHDIMIRYGGDVSNRRSEIGKSSSCSFFGSGTLSSAEFGVDTKRRMHSVLATHRWAVGDRALNQVTVHAVRSGEERLRLNDGPALVRPTICDGGNHFAWDRKSTRVEIKDDFSFDAAGLMGTHRLKFGAQISVIDVDSDVFNVHNGAFLFPADTSSLPLLFLGGLESGFFGVDERGGQIAFYAQDSWSPTRTLTLNLGLRFDLETNGTNQGFENPDAASLPFVTSINRSRDGNNLAPRFGVAWDVAGHGRTVVRGGFGIFYDQLAVWHAGLESSAFPAGAILNPGTSNIDDLPPIDPNLAPRVLPGVMDSVMPTPFTRQYSLGIQTLLPGGIVLQVDGLFIQGRNLILIRERNPFTEDPNDPPPARIFPAYQSIGQLLARGEAETKMLILRLHKNLPWGGINLHYTLADRKATADRWFDFVPVADTANDFSSEFGPVDWDERHRLVLLADARLPLGLEAATKIIYSSARPYSALSGVDTNRDNFLNDRPAGEGRNSRRGPDFFRVDLGLTRYFPVGRANLGIILNVYNLLNRTNLNASSVVESIQSQVFGQALTALPRRQAEIGMEVRF
jgi:outer membrane receptor protein involved in Fe transport